MIGNRFVETIVPAREGGGLEIVGPVDTTIEITEQVVVEWVQHVFFALAFRANRPVFLFDAYARC